MRLHTLTPHPAHTIKGSVSLYAPAPQQSQLRLMVDRGVAKTSANGRNGRGGATGGAAKAKAAWSDDARDGVLLVLLLVAVSREEPVGN